MCVQVCMCAPEVIINYSHILINYTAAMALTVDIKDGDGLSNKVYHEQLPKEPKVKLYI